MALMVCKSSAGHDGRVGLREKQMKKLILGSVVFLLFALLSGCNVGPVETTARVTPEPDPTQVENHPGLEDPAVCGLAVISSPGKGSPDHTDFPNRAETGESSWRNTRAGRGWVLGSLEYRRACALLG
jgi:hypothetical protein